jgi:hypothetical protein
MRIGNERKNISQMEDITLCLLDDPDLLGKITAEAGSRSFSCAKCYWDFDENCVGLVDCLW